VAKKPKKLEDLFHETLKDIYFAENKILKTLPKMAKAAQSKDLRAAFVRHERETKGQVKRLDRVFKIIGKPARGKTCAAINGITEEGSEIMKDFRGMPALDAGLLASAQAVEHYEISRYGTLSTWAEELGYEEAVDLLEATLQRKRTQTRRSRKLPNLSSMSKPMKARTKTSDQRHSNTNPDIFRRACAEACRPPAAVR
jgi:ferritin-like metal-binding protein YciE